MAMLSLVFTPLLLTFIPCDQESDFQGTRKFTGTVKCNDVFSANSWYINRYYPASAKDCNTRPDGDTKAKFIEISYSRCCKPGSEPNGFCGLKKASLPCDQVSDFLGEKDISSGVSDFVGLKCRDAYYYGQVSAGECNEIVGDNGPSKAVILKSLYANCCRPGSKPNGICGFKKMDTTTPCKSKSVGEFLPGAW